MRSVSRSDHTAPSTGPFFSPPQLQLHSYSWLLFWLIDTDVNERKWGPFDVGRIRERVTRAESSSGASSVWERFRAMCVRLFSLWWSHTHFTSDWIDEDWILMLVWSSSTCMSETNFAKVVFASPSYAFCTRRKSCRKITWKASRAAHHPTCCLPAASSSALVGFCRTEIIFSEVNIKYAD